MLQPPVSDRRRRGRLALKTAPPRKPTAAGLLAASNRKVPDLIGPGLSVLFCGINPGLYSAATGFHFARPGNRFWPALLAGGFTKRVLAPWEEKLLLPLGYGVTALVARATARADELSDEEYVKGRRILERKIRRYEPRWLAVLGLGAYRAGFDRPRATIGPQPERIGNTGIWILPNPSGLNANHQLPQLAEMFRALRLASKRKS